MATIPLPGAQQPPGAQPDPADTTASPDSQSAPAPSPPSGDAEDDDSFSVAEDVGLDPQSAHARRAGQAPDGEPQPGATTAPDAMAESLASPDSPA
jgi:hypothetical protein